MLDKLLEINNSRKLIPKLIL